MMSVGALIRGSRLRNPRSGMGHRNLPAADRLEARATIAAGPDLPFVELESACCDAWDSGSLHIARWSCPGLITNRSGIGASSSQRPKGATRTNLRTTWG